MLIPIKEISSYKPEELTGLLIALGYDNDQIISLGHEYFNYHISKESKNIDTFDDGYSTVIPALLILKNLDLEDFDKIIIGYEGHNYKGFRLDFKYDRKIQLFNSNETCSIINPSSTLIKSFIDRINHLIRSSVNLNFQKRYIIINNLFGTIKKESTNYNTYETTVNFNVINFDKDRFLVENYNDVRKLRNMARRYK